MTKPSWIRRGSARAGRAFARLRELCPFTLSGWALLALAAAAAWFLGVKRLDLMLLTSALLLAALLLLLSLATLAAALLLRRRLRDVAPLERLSTSCGAWTPTGFRARLPFWLPFLSLRVEWEAPFGVEAELHEATGEERIRARHRGVAERVRRRFTLGDILGLSAFSWRSEQAASLQLLPARAALDKAAALQGLVPGEEIWNPLGERRGDRVDIRKYGPGDPLRMVLWKVYARSRQLFVRMPEQAVEAAPRVCAYLPANAFDEPPARLARTVLEEGLLGEGWRFGSDGSEAAESLDAALAALARSGSLPAGAPGGLSAFLAKAVADGFGACLLFLPVAEGAWLPELQRELAACPLRVHAVLAFEGWSRPRPGRLRRLLLKDPERSGAEAEVARRLLSALALPELRSSLLDTVSGELLEEPSAFLGKRAHEVIA